MLFLALVALCVVKSTSSNEYSMQDSTGGCVYNFQVWEPNQDVLSQLRRLDNRCSNISHHVEQQVALLKNQFLGEVVSSRNFSQSLERDVMQQKVERLQLDVATKDIQMQLMNLKAEVRRSGRGRGGGGVNEEVFGSLKNAVGDLKAEWLLIKRDVQVVRSEAERQNEEHETYAVQMKEEVQGLKEGSLRLSRRQEELRDEVNSLTEADSKGEMDRLRREQSQLYSKVAKLEADLRSLQSQHSALAQQLLAVVMETFNATNDALTSWVEKMPAIRTEPEWERSPRATHSPHQRRVRAASSPWGDIEEDVDDMTTVEVARMEDLVTVEDVDTPRLLTLFTTFKPSRERMSIYQSIIRNWGQLGPDVQPVLYATPGDQAMTDYARDHGWLVFPVPKHNKYRTPFLKDMYLHAEQNIYSDFYGYANGDLLFDSGLVRTLKSILNDSNSTMVVGRRINYSLKDVTKPLTGTTIRDFMDQHNVLASSVRMFKALAIDYFIVNRDGMKWKKVPKFVVGRAGYDNYLIYYAKKRAKISVVDASRTIRTLHLQGDGFKLTHRSANDKDGKFNIRIIQRLKEFPSPLRLIQEGNVNMAQLETRLNNVGQVEVVSHRRVLTKKKLPPLKNRVGEVRL